MTQEQLNAIQEQTKKITNPKLLEVMRTLKKCAEEKTNPEPQYQVDYIDNLMEARLLAPVTVTDMSGENENQMKVQFSHLTNPQNEKYFMVFTDMETMQKNINDISKICVIAVTYKDLSAMLSQPKCAMKGFVINPFTENIICGPKQAEVIANYIRQKKFNSGELTVINEVTGVPDTVTKPITSYFDSRKDIKKAYIMNMRKINQLNRLIIVDFEGEDDKFNDFTKDFTEKADNRHQLIRIACHLHGNKGGKLGSLLDGSTARRLFLIRSFRHLEAGKHLVVGFRVAVYIFYKSPLLLQGNSGDMAHQLFVKFITFLTDGEVSNHSGKSRSNSTVQSGNTTATGDGIATRHFIQKFLYCQIN